MPSHIPEGKIKIFAKSRVEGKTMTQSAIDAGYPVKSAREAGSSLDKNPRVEEEKQRLYAIYGLDEVSMLKELAKGLRHGKLGSHADYLDKGMRMNGMLGQKADSNQAPLFNVENLIVEAQKRGIVLDAEAIAATPTAPIPVPLEAAVVVPVDKPVDTSDTSVSITPVNNYVDNPTNDPSNSLIIPL